MPLLRGELRDLPQRNHKQMVKAFIWNVKKDLAVKTQFSLMLSLGGNWKIKQKECFISTMCDTHWTFTPGSPEEAWAKGVSPPPFAPERAAGSGQAQMSGWFIWNLVKTAVWGWDPKAGHLAFSDSSAICQLLWSLVSSFLKLGC